MPASALRWYRHPLALTTGGLIAATALHAAGWLAPVEAVAVLALRPLQAGLIGASSAVGERWQGHRDAAALRRELTRVNAAWQRLALENQRLKRQVAESAALTTQADFLRQRDLPAVAARVVGREFSPSAQMIVVDRGRRSGLSAGAAVVARDGILIGHVAEVGEEHAKVMLLTDGRSAVAAALERADDVTGVASGEFSDRLELALIPLEVPLAAGDLVLTAIQPAGGAPGGLLIGTVSRVASSSAPFFHEAYVQPALPYQTISVVAVLLDAGPR